jgi:hypothetical protein
VACYSVSVCTLSYFPQATMKIDSAPPLQLNPITGRFPLLLTNSLLDDQ